MLDIIDEKLILPKIQNTAPRGAIKPAYHLAGAPPQPMAAWSLAGMDIAALLGVPLPATFLQVSRKSLIAASVLFGAFLDY